ncbi:verrucotoxin subunit beta-like [Megalobrama amblycephala]|uniref:verrucotoxin subunit beta-like n=1 Tax=Megalobrama amblycephala TaxID=75352 RepID=UPI00201462EE|nr:verrucotoxin subunit beta-like [Megalobrama amblycephala]
MESKPIEVAALGRPLFPGMLYDCRSDTFIPGVTLWDKKSLSEDLDSHPQPMTDVKFSSSDSLSSKSSLLDVSASLKTSFLGGLVKVGGSGKFLSDTKSSNQQSRVTMNYSETTRFDQLTMTQLGQITYPEVFDQKTATHVVTAVLYGAQAFMVFDETFSEEENQQEIEGKLNVMVKAIPGFSIGGEGALEMTEEDKEEAESISCTFHGDVRLDQNPTNYMEALEVYKTLPTILKENPQNAVPIKVWLYPLSLLDSKAAQLVREITAHLVSNTEDIIEGLLEAERTCNDLSRNPLVNVFRDVKERLSLFQGSLNIYKTVFMKAVAKVLPAIRGGETEEKSLADILKIHYSSPFKADMLNQWLDDAKFELDLLSSQIKKLKGIKTEDSNHLKILLSDPDIDVVVCLTFTSLNYKDQYLSNLKEFLESDAFKKLDEVVKKSSSTSASEEWSNDLDDVLKMRENLSLFRSFSETNKDEKTYRFIISAISDSSSPGSSIYLYEKGKLTDKKFQPVSKPPPPEVKEVKERSVSLKLQKSPTGETVQYRVEYQQVKEEQWLVKNTSDEDFTLTGLEFGQQYLIRYRIVGKVGVSEASDTISLIPSSGTDPKTRDDFLQYSLQLTLDLNTVNELLCLSERNTSWSLEGSPSSYIFRHNDIEAKLPVKPIISSRSVNEENHCRRVNTDISRLPNVHLAHHPTLDIHNLHDHVHLRKDNVNVFAKNLKDVALGRTAGCPSMSNRESSNSQPQRRFIPAPAHVVFPPHPMEPYTAAPWRHRQWHRRPAPLYPYPELQHPRFPPPHPHPIQEHPAPHHRQHQHHQDLVPPYQQRKKQPRPQETPAMGSNTTTAQKPSAPQPNVHRPEQQEQLSYAAVLKGPNDTHSPSLREIKDKLNLICTRLME